MFFKAGLGEMLSGLHELIMVNKCLNFIAYHFCVPGKVSSGLLFILQVRMDANNWLIVIALVSTLFL